jgi:hypothetical protein
LIKDTEEIIINVKNNQDSTLVVADSLSRMAAQVDGNKPKSIRPTSIRSDIVNAGNHQIRFNFISQPFEIGKE